jgi:hypothetical protein
MKSSFLRILLPFAALAFVGAGSAFAQKNSGTSTGPTVIPGGTVTSTYVINKSGSYVLGGDRVMSTAQTHVIEIAAPDVTLDLGGFSLSCLAGVTPGHGVYMASTDNVEIRNGTVAKTNMGVYAASGKGLRINNVRFTSGFKGGVYVETNATQIDRCQVVDSGSYGLAVFGFGALITDCVVSNSGTAFTLGQGGRLERCVSERGTHGVVCGTGATIVDSTATGASIVGMAPVDRATLRNVDVSENNIGLSIPQGAVVFVTGSRSTNNTTNLQGVYVNGGGNFIQ